MRGRSIVALVLVGFVLVATGVIWRRSYGIAHALDQQKLEQQRAALEAGATPSRWLCDETSRGVLSPCPAHFKPGNHGIANVWICA